MPDDAPKNLNDVLALIGGQKRPPVKDWNPDLCGDIDIRIARDGTWYYLGTPIGRKRLVRLFSSVLRRDPDGEIYLVTPVEKLKIEVDDAPFLAVEMLSEGEGRNRILSFRTQTGDWVVAGPDHPIRVEADLRTGEPSPYVMVRDGLEALINRPVFYELVEMAEKKRKGNTETLGVWSSGKFFPIGDL